MTVAFRKNKLTKPYTKFNITPFERVFNTDRMQAMRSKDALVWPFESLDHIRDDLVYRDPGQPDLGKLSTLGQNLKDKVIRDHANRIIYKFDRLHGQQNAGLFCQSTFGRNNLPPLSEI